MTASTPAVVEGAEPRTLALVRPIVSPAALIEMHSEIAALVTKALKDGVDYGTIPGTARPTLLKPGAERLCLAFGCAPRYEIVASEIDHDRAVAFTKRKKVWRNQFHGDRSFDWKEESGAAVGLYRYVVRCDLVRRDSGDVVASGAGSASTMESKYVDRPRECENTILKMAQKRALVAAALNAFGLSDRFTQDVEDLDHAEQETNGRQPTEAATDDGEVVRVALDTPVPFGKAKDAGQTVAQAGLAYFRRVVNNAKPEDQEARWFLFAKAAVELLERESKMRGSTQAEEITA